MKSEDSVKVLNKEQSNEARLFDETIRVLIDVNQVNAAIEFLEKEWERFNCSEIKNYFMLVAITGNFITIGGLIQEKNLVEKGLKILIDNYDILCSFNQSNSSYSINYNIALGYENLYRIKYKPEIFKIPNFEEIKDYTSKAKDYYYKSYKCKDTYSNTAFKIQLFNNMANNLTFAGRFVEAIQILDTAIKEKQDFVEAIYSRGDALKNLVRLRCYEKLIIGDDCFIFDLFSTYKNCLEYLKNDTPLQMIEKFKQNYDGINKEVIKKGAGKKDIEENRKNRLIEFNNMSFEDKFYLDNYLNLSIHGLYCRCSKSLVEDFGFNDNFISEKTKNIKPLFERIKNEFLYARFLFFQYWSDKEKNDSSSLNNNLINIESLRTSFRLCFGILDKIARGICLYFDLLENEKENIYFESFWKKNRKNKDKRWDKICTIKNIHLTALYSIASDLNESSKGEFGMYKKWRNDLEHSLFLIIEKKNDDSYKNAIELSEFEEKTKHLLQLTRSAIFSFVFCIDEKNYEIFHSTKN